MKKENKYDIFISYRRSDGYAVAENFYLALEKRGYRVFFDKKDIKTGEFPKEIEKSINQSNEFLCIVTNDYFGFNKDGQQRIRANDDWVRREIEIAISGKKNIFPILIDCQQPEKKDLPKSIVKILEFQSEIYDKSIHTSDTIIDKINDGFSAETHENALVGAIRYQIKDIEISDKEFNIKCKELIKYVETSNVASIEKIINKKDIYDLKDRYAAFYILFTYYRRLQENKKLVELVEKYHIEFINTNEFYNYAMSEYYKLKSQFSEDITEKTDYLRGMLKYTKKSRDIADDNNGMVHSYCEAIAICLENEVPISETDLNLALNEIDRIITNSPDYALYYSTKARLLAQINQFESALANNLRAQLLQTPTHDDWQKRMANYYKEECLIKIRQMKYEFTKEKQDDIKKRD